MSTTGTRRLAAAAAADVRPAETAVIPTVPVRRSVLHPARPAPRDEGACPASTVTLPAVTLPAAAGAGWRGQAVTEELPAVTARRSTLPRRPSRRTALRRHLLCALAGTLLAVVAVTGLSAYAAAGVTDARSTAPCQARAACR